MFNLLKIDNDRDILDKINLKTAFDICYVFSLYNEFDLNVGELFEKFIPNILENTDAKDIYTSQLLIILNAKSIAQWDNNDVVDMIINYYKQKGLLNFDDPLYRHNIALDLFISVSKNLNYNSAEFSAMIKEFFNKRVRSMSADHLEKYSMILKFTHHFESNEEVSNLKDQIQYFLKLRNKHRYKIRKIEIDYERYLAKKRYTIRELYNMRRYR